MKHALAALLATSLFAPTAALACSPGSACYGTAMLRAVDTTSYLVNTDTGIEWATLAAPFQQRELIASYDPYTVDAANGWSGRPPVMKLSPDGARQILWVPDSTTATTESAGIYELHGTAVTTVGIPGSAMHVTGFDAIYQDSGEPLLLVSTDYSKLHLLTRADEVSDFQEIAQGDALNCTTISLSLLPNADGFLGMCGDHPLTRAGDQIAVGDPLLGTQPIAVAGTRDNGAEIFFAVSPASDNSSVAVDRLTRANGTWQIDHASTLPLGTVNDDESITVPSRNLVAIVGETSGDYEPALYVVQAEGAGWVSESAGKVDYTDRVSAVIAGESAQLLTGSVRMRLHSHTANGWATKDLGKIGHQSNFTACSIGGLDEIPAMGSLLLGIASLLAFALRRR